MLIKKITYTIQIWLFFRSLANWKKKKETGTRKQKKKLTWSSLHHQSDIFSISWWRSLSAELQISQDWPEKEKLKNVWLWKKILVGRLKNRKSSMLEYFWIESLKNKTQPLKSKRRSRSEEIIKRAKRELKRNRHKSLHGHYLSPGVG